MAVSNAVPVLRDEPVSLKAHFRGFIRRLQGAIAPATDAGITAHPDVQTAIDWLRAEVMPLMLEAWKALAEIGVGVDIEEDFDVAAPSDTAPSISFQCVGPSRHNVHGRAERPRSNRYFFVCDGRIFRTGVVDHFVNSRSFRPLGPPMSLKVAASRQVARRTIEDAIRNYFDLIRS